jgi:hypothetical protein
MFPIVIAKWERNSRKVVRVALDRFNDRDTVNVRIWYYRWIKLIAFSHFLW